MKLAEINEHTGLEFSDISSEEWRRYTFPDGNDLLISFPQFLHVSASGGHRLYCSDGQCWYIQPKEGWHIQWMVGSGQPPFINNQDKIQP